MKTFKNIKKIVAGFLLLSFIQLNFMPCICFANEQNQSKKSIIKTGIKREKIGDIITKFEGADIIVLKDTIKYVLEGLKQLTRFNKAQFEILQLSNLEIEEPKMEKINIIIPSMRTDSIVSEIIRTSSSC